MIRALVFLFLLGGTLGARADDLVSGLSTDLVQITSSFTGTDFVLFGALETTDTEPRDIVVVIRGPTQSFTVRRKARVAGLWINTDQVVFSGLPGYYFLASTRPLDDIATLPMLARFGLGTANLQAGVPPGTSADEAAAFRAAAIRTKKRDHLYWESPTGIEFLSHSLFRARIPIPASVPPGQYRAEVYLFRKGNVVSAQSSPLFIDKTGLERRVFNLAHQNGIAYGLAAVLMALSLGAAGYFLLRQKT